MGDGDPMDPDNKLEIDEGQDEQRTEYAAVSRKAAMYALTISSLLRAASIVQRCVFCSVLFYIPCEIANKMY